MSVELLVSTMNCKSPEKLYADMNIQGKALFINQVTKDDGSIINKETATYRMFSYKEKGLSASRNRALKQAVGDICTLSDDDMSYVKDYEKIIKDSYKKYSKADIIAFSFLYPDGKERARINEGEVGLVGSMKLCSAMVTYKRSSVVLAGVEFDPLFGAGAKYPWGEENIFLFDCIKKGLRVYYVPIVIGQLRPGESSWSKESSKEHFEAQGAIFCRMAPRWYGILIAQFVLRKRNIYISNMSSRQVAKCMFSGAKKYRREKWQ